MTVTWEEAEVAALYRQEWRRSVAQCIHLDAGWIKVKVKESAITGMHNVQHSRNHAFTLYAARRVLFKLILIYCEEFLLTLTRTAHRVCHHVHTTTINVWWRFVHFKMLHSIRINHGGCHQLEAVHRPKLRPMAHDSSSHHQKLVPESRDVNFADVNQSINQFFQRG